MYKERDKPYKIQAGKSIFITAELMFAKHNKICK